MTLPIVLFFFQDISLTLFFISLIILFFACNVIFSFRLIKKYNNKKTIIEQTRVRLEKIQKDKKQIEKQAKEKNLFYTSLIHEIKVPLAIFRNSFNTYFKQQTKKDNNLFLINTCLERLNRDIVNLLDAEIINKMQKLYIHTNVINVSKAIKKEVDVFKCITNNKKINLTLLSEGLLFVKINPHGFDRIVNNLLDNAVKYTHTQKGGEINISLKSDPSFIYLAIKDNGVGISEDKLNKIFNPYYRIKKESYSPGLGIGLFLVKKIIESVNGRIEVKSEPDKGSTFTVIFPKCKPSDIENIVDVVPTGPVGKKEFDFLAEIYDRDKYTIMLVEDNIDMLKFLQRNLKNYNVFFATNGQEALNKLIHIPKPDIIISDIMMDIMDGHEFFGKISENDRYNDIPFIFLTSRTRKNEKLESLKNGVIDFICKPFLVEELKAKIHSILKKLDMVKETKIKKMEKRISEVIRIKGDDKFLEFEKKCKEYKLSPREKEVLQGLMNGLQIKEIAAQLFLSMHTIRNHIKHIYAKCKVQNRVELMIIFKE